MKQNFMQMFQMFNSFHLVPRLEVRMSCNALPHQKALNIHFFRLLKKRYSRIKDDTNVYKR